jgi:deoxyribodipyrimidine photo-lyase
LKDNKTLVRAAKAADELLVVYCDSPREEQTLKLGFKKRGVFRTAFLLEALSDLKQSLNNIGGDLLVAKGSAADIIPGLCEKYGCGVVYYSQEDAWEEQQDELNLQRALNRINVDWQSFWNSTLVDKGQMPFAVKNLPDVFTSFRVKVEKEHCFEQPFGDFSPEGFVPFEEQNESLELGKFCGQEKTNDQRAALDFVGGETAAWQRLRHYFWETNAIASYKETRNGLVGQNYSSKFSPWLSLGCISPVSIYEELKKYEKERVANDSTYWLVFELLWRDFFRFTLAKHGTKVFKRTGFTPGPSRSWNQDKVAFNKWMNGETGDAFIDANMKEMRATGWMSNRGRQNVASYLVHDLKVDWTWGAAYFESVLLDYDVHSNWGNWAYIAGVGNDPRPNRYFNTNKQAGDYDRDHRFRKLWLPERYTN